MSEPIFCGLFRKRQSVLPTLRGWLVLVGIVGVVGIVMVKGACHFLTVVEPVPAEILVVEGWSLDYVMREALAEFRRHPYKAVYVTGSGVDRGAELAVYKTYAEAGAAILVRMGMDPAALHPIPAEQVKRDRTYASAMELRRALEAQTPPQTKFNIVTGDTHSRRTRLLFEKAFGPGAEVGVIGVPSPEFDPDRWWASSDGFRSVINELVAYAYARLLFRPPSD